MNYKRFLFFPCLFFIALLLACPGLQRERMGRIDAIIDFDTGLKQSKAIDPTTLSAVSPILPGGGWTPLYYRLSGLGPGGATFSEESADGNFSIECAPGEWILEATAISQDNMEIARGSRACLLQPGKTIKANIVLYPLDGSGELSVYVIENLEMPAGARLVGQLRFKGLPGQPTPLEPLAIPIDQPASDNELLFPELAAGYYLLCLELRTEDGFVSGGCAVAALVLAGYSSCGACSITMGFPVAGIGMELYPKEPLTQALLSVEHSAPEGTLVLPIAVSRAKTEPGDAIARTWYRNGGEAGPAVPILQGPSFLPPDCFLFPPSGAGQETNLSRIDFTEETGSSHRFGTASLLLESCAATAGLPWKATAVYDYRAATGSSLCPQSPDNQGSGAPFRASCAAASESGLIVVSDFDAEKYLHAFVAPYGAALDTSVSPGLQAVPPSASWLRLWRSRIRAGDLKSADILAISRDGRFIAAAADSSAQWIWLCSVDEYGKIVSTSYLTGAESSGLESFKCVKALCFSPSGDRLYAACSSSNKVYTFDTGAGSLEYLYSKELKTGDDASLPPADMVITASGLIAVSAPSDSKIFIMQDQAGLEILECLESGEENTDLYKPEALVASSQGDAFYALCNRESVVRFSMSGAVSTYVQDSLIDLSADSAGATRIAAGSAGSGSSDTILVGGGDCLEFLEIASDGSGIESQLVYPVDSDALGFGSLTSISYCRGAFLIAGGDSCTVTVFGNDM